MLEPSTGVVPIALFAIGLIVVMTIWLFVRFLRAYRTRPATNPTTATIEAMEAEVAQLRTDVTNLVQGRDFATQLLARRSTKGAFELHNARDEPATLLDDTSAKNDQQSNAEK